MGRCAERARFWAKRNKGERVGLRSDLDVRGWLDWTPAAGHPLPAQATPRTWTLLREDVPGPGRRLLSDGEAASDLSMGAMTGPGFDSGLPLGYAAYSPCP